MNVSVPQKQIPIYVAQNENGEVTDHIIMAMAGKRKMPCCSSHKSPKRKPMTLVCGNLQYPNTFFKEEKSEKITGREV